MNRFDQRIIGVQKGKVRLRHLPELIAIQSLQVKIIIHPDRVNYMQMPEKVKHIDKKRSGC